MVIAAIGVLGLTGLTRAQSNIDPTDKYAWGENVGWTNWRDADGGAAGVVAGDHFLSGYIWGENVGWINVGDGTPGDDCGGLPCYANLDDTDFGVNVDADGTLFGYAWGENIGWINFDTSTLGGDRALFDRCQRQFFGYAWGENVGWINLEDPTHFVALEPCGCTDCNTNGVPDDCDIADGSSEDLNTNGIPDECEVVAPVLDAVACCSFHGAFYLCLDLPQSGGTLPIEPRRWQPADTQEFEVTLTGPAGGAVTVSASCTDGSTPIPDAVTENSPGVLTVEFNPPLPNAECCTLTLSGGASGLADVWLLFGDSSRNGAVNSADKNLIAAEVGTFANASSVFWYDMDRNNAINTADKSLCSAQIGTALDARSAPPWTPVARSRQRGGFLTDRDSIHRCSL